MDDDSDDKTMTDGQGINLCLHYSLESLIKTEDQLTNRKQMATHAGQVSWWKLLREYSRGYQNMEVRKRTVILVSWKLSPCAMLSFSFPLKLHANYLRKRKGWNETKFTFWISCTVDLIHFHNMCVCVCVCMWGGGSWILCSQNLYPATRIPFISKRRCHKSKVIPVTYYAFEGSLTKRENKLSKTSPWSTISIQMVRVTGTSHKPSALILNLLY